MNERVEDEQDIVPGLMVVHGNQPDALRALLVTWVKRFALRPLEDEIVLVQSNGIAQWLRLALAADPADDEKRDAGGRSAEPIESGCGIAAAISAQLPSRFIWQAYRAVLGESAVPKQSPFDKPLLIWRLMRLLPALLAEPLFAPLHRFLANDADLRKRYQLAERLADLFDQYQVYRADWLTAWAQGADYIQTSRQGLQPVPEMLRWQPRLWRALLEDVGAALAETSRAGIHRQFLQATGAEGHLAPVGEPATAAGERPRKLARRVIVFGISTLPQQALEVLSALSRWTQVLMFVHNPSEHHWADIIADQDLLRAAHRRQARKPGMPAVLDAADLHLHAHPLLAAWGKQGRDFIGLLEQHDDRRRYEPHFEAVSERIDLFASNGDATLLQQLQDDVRALRSLAETQERWPAVDLRRDESIRFHIAHSPQREVEILHDQLLAAFVADPTLQPRDVIVMVPDIAVYAPHVEAVFGLLEARDPRFIPFRLADQSARHHDPLIHAVEKLLGLPQSRVAVSDVLDLLDVPAFRSRFGVEEASLPLLRRWIGAANIRWGLHAEQRRDLDLPGASAQNTWSFGLDRMLLGYATGAGPAWQGIEPLDEVGGLDAALLGPLIACVDTIERLWRGLREPAAPAAWGERLRGLLEACFAATEGDDGYTLLRLETTLQAWLDACADAAFESELPLSVVREHWLAQLDDGGLAQPFFAGAVTFATLMPMRSIPFRFIGLLGMNDGDYPRTRVPMDFDLMARDYRPGDRSRRDDDRYLFLEAVLSARDRLHISWVGNSIHDNTPRPPSVLVAQLRDHLAAGWRPGGRDERDERAERAEAQRETAPASVAAVQHEGLLEALTVTHRLQPFHRDYFVAQGAEAAVAAPQSGATVDAASRAPDETAAESGSDPRLFSFAHEWRDGHADSGGGQIDNGKDTGVPLTPRTPLPAIAWDADLTLRHLADFLADPVKAFFRQRLKVHLELFDPVHADLEPFDLDGLARWRLQDELILAQCRAMAAGESREAALEAQLRAIAGRGELPMHYFAVAAEAALREPMPALFDAYDAIVAQWPNAIADEPITDASSGVPVSDWLGDLRADAGGARARVLIDSGELVQGKGKGHYRRDRLPGYWVPHVAAHLGGRALTTVIVSKKGAITLMPLDLDAARSAWQTLLGAWAEGMSRPLPLAIRTGFAFLEKGREAARECYEDDEALSRIVIQSECSKNPYLRRAFPRFDDLWSDGEFEQWTAKLLEPIGRAIKHKSDRDGESQGDGT